MKTYTLQSWKPCQVTNSLCAFSDCMRSFRESGDFRYKQIWSRVNKEDKKRDLPIYDHVLKDDNRDDYFMKEQLAGQYYCPLYFNMTAIQIHLGNLCKYR